MSIYETVDDMKVTQNLVSTRCMFREVDRTVAKHFFGICCNVTLLLPLQPQTLYDKINYQRHPAVSANTSSPYQEVLWVRQRDSSCIVLSSLDLVNHSPIFVSWPLKSCIKCTVLNISCWNTFCMKDTCLCKKHSSQCTPWQQHRLGPDLVVGGVKTISPKQ